MSILSISRAEAIWLGCKIECTASKCGKKEQFELCREHDCSREDNPKCYEAGESALAAPTLPKEVKKSNADDLKEIKGHAIAVLEKVIKKDYKTHDEVMELMKGANTKYAEKGIISGKVKPGAPEEFKNLFATCDKKCTKDACGQFKCLYLYCKYMCPDFATARCRDAGGKAWPNAVIETVTPKDDKSKDKAKGDAKDAEEKPKGKSKTKAKSDDKGDKPKAKAKSKSKSSE